MDYLWEQPTYADIVPLEPIATELFFGIGDRVSVLFQNGVSYRGYLCDTDPIEQTALVRYWDRQRQEWRKEWVNVTQIKEAA